MMEEKESKDESFADLFEAYSSGMNEDVQIGDMLRGKIISIGRESVFVDTGTKIDGIVDRDELLDENRELPFKEGDEIELYVVSNNGNEIRLSKTFSGVANRRMIGEAFRKTVPVEGKVKAECKGGFHVEVMGKRAFCPISQMDLKYVENPADYVGETLPFLITQFEEEGRNIVISRRELLQKELEARKKEFFEGLTIGTQLEGRVTKLMHYGAFVELLPGIEGMIHLSEISWSRTERPENILTTGDIVSVKIIGMEEGKRPGEMKLALSIKQMTGDPWLDLEGRFSIGDKITGKVTKCAHFGAFVEIAPGIEGLVHISEMSYKKRVLKVEDVVTAGDTVEVMIKEIDAENRRISLSMRDAEGDPWVDIANKYKEGQSVKGVIEKKERFGYFVSLEPGITGLLPMSKIGHIDKTSAIGKLGHGDIIPVVVEKVDPEERRITLHPGDTAGESDWRRYLKDSEKSIGSLGEKLQQALKSKEE
ncbi:MAG: 30S ribosomal protein S1 [Deltaproteobacteria bacterium]|nr:30S ribosomal protein S1 [Deltaproteobacteria bacterium]